MNCHLYLRQVHHLLMSLEICVKETIFKILLLYHLSLMKMHKIYFMNNMTIWWTTHEWCYHTMLAGGWNHGEKTCQRAARAVAVDLVRLHAHGWDPLIPTDAGVYDGLQEAPRYVCLAGYEYWVGSTGYAVMGGHVVCGEARRMVWNLRPGFTPWKCGVRIPLGQKAGEPLWVK